MVQTTQMGEDSKLKNISANDNEDTMNSNWSNGSYQVTMSIFSKIKLGKILQKRDRNPEPQIHRSLKPRNHKQQSWLEIKALDALWKWQKHLQVTKGLPEPIDHHDQAMNHWFRREAEISEAKFRSFLRKKMIIDEMERKDEYTLAHLFDSEGLREIGLSKMGQVELTRPIFYFYF